MGAFFTAILSKVVGVAKFMGLLAVAVFLGGWDFLRDVFAWVVEEFLKGADALLAKLDVGALTTPGSGMGGLPAEVFNVLGLLGIGDCLTIIVAAIGIRLALQLIPFTRLGS